jgi:cell division protein DivIC
MTILKKHQTVTSPITTEEQDHTQNRLYMKKRALIKRLSVLGGLAVVCLVFFTVSLSNQSAKISAKVEQKEALEAQFMQLEEEAKELELEIDKLGNPEYRGQVLRQERQWSKPGETIYYISK